MFESWHEHEEEVGEGEGRSCDSEGRRQAMLLGGGHAVAHWFQIR